MITNKSAERVNMYSAARQRLGNKTLYNNTVINQNNQQVRYFSGIDAEIYFGDVYVDETVAINFTVQQQVLPLYGYNSYIYDDISLGSRLVQGQFTINFTSAGYMYNVLDTLVAINNNNSGVRTTYINSRAPLWNKKFDIYMSYGDARQNPRVAKSTILVLKQVSLVSCGQELDYTGKPIYETYSFVARDIDFLSEGEYKDATGQNHIIESESVVEPIKAIKLTKLDDDSMEAVFDFENDLELTSVLFKNRDTSAFISLFGEEKPTFTLDTNRQSTYTAYIDYDQFLLGSANTTKDSLQYHLEVSTTYLDAEGNEHTRSQFITSSS